MARPPYSKRFIGAMATGVVVEATVPAGKLWIINCVTYVLVSGSSGFVFAFVDGADPLYIFDINVSTDLIKGNFFTHQVMNEGEVLKLHSTGGDAEMSCMISGFELTIAP